MKRLISVMESAEELVATLAVSMLFLLLVLQVFFRFVLNSPLAWSEEAARYVFIWMVFIGASYAMGKNTHISLDLFSGMIPSKVSRWLKVFTRIASMVFLIAAAYGGFNYARTLRSVQSTALRIPVMYVYLSLPVAALLMVIHLTHLLAQDLGSKPNQT